MAKKRSIEQLGYQVAEPVLHTIHICNSHDVVNMTTVVVADNAKLMVSFWGQSHAVEQQMGVHK